ncbi:MAG: hypothetical protein ACO2ZM_02835 [Francisellaceae bacterium]
MPDFINADSDAGGSTNAAISFSGLFGGINLDLEISALEYEGDARVISSPHLVVSDNTEAYIKQGQEVPYNESTASGAASVAFKEAVLELRVIPQIAPDGHIILDVTISKDAVSNDSSADGIPILDKREISTRLMVKDGQTIVLGGIYEKTNYHQRTKVPLLGDLPLLGWLFSSISTKATDDELLIFLTPSVIKNNDSDIDL